MSAVVPSEYAPIAVNCWVESTNKLGGLDGATVMEDNIAAGVVVE